MSKIFKPKRGSLKNAQEKLIDSAILQKGEIFLEIPDEEDPNRNGKTYGLKIGDGANKYFNLPYIYKVFMGEITLESIEHGVLYGGVRLDQDQRTDIHNPNAKTEIYPMVTCLSEYNYSKFGKAPIITYNISFQNGFPIIMFNCRVEGKTFVQGDSVTIRYVIYEK